MAKFRIGDHIVSQHNKFWKNYKPNISDFLECAKNLKNEK